ncbi:MAG: tRNA (adenosine(37)-N6)-threonylcarbamoyltransferase complex ATPase subunit type 1 TsaE [Candidatus Omnitrophota bacterium]
MRYITKSPAETLDLGYRLGKTLARGSVVALIGELGAGKTIFTKGIAKALGVKEYEYVNSASFVIMKEYTDLLKRSRRIPLYHFDLYRIKSSHDLETVGCEDLFYGKGVSVVEWADRSPDALPEKHICVKFKHLGGDKRAIDIKTKSQKSKTKDQKQILKV